MIDESRHWKEPLLKSAAWLVRLRLGSNARESTFVKLEKEFFVGFYAIRKLIEANKLTTELVNSKFSVVSFPNLKPLNHLNWHHIYGCFDFERSSVETRDLEFVCNLFIHSFVFMGDLTDKGKVEGFYVTTSKKKDARLYFVHSDVVIEIFRYVGNDEVNFAEYVRAEDGEFKFFAE